MTIWKHHTEVDMDNHKITSVADSTTAQDAATKNYVDVRLPTGSITMWGTDTAPPGWHLCNGASLLRAGTYADLFGIIGTAFGTADGTHFNVPDMRQKFPLGVAAAGTGNTLAGTGGAIDHTHTTPTHSLTTAEMAVHSHTNSVGNQSVSHNHGWKYYHSDTIYGNLGLNSSRYIAKYPSDAAYIARSTYTHTHNLMIGNQSASHNHSVTINNSGSGTAHEHGATGTNNAPFLALNFIIKY